MTAVAATAENVMYLRRDSMVVTGRIWLLLLLPAACRRPQLCMRAAEACVSGLIVRARGVGPLLGGAARPAAAQRATPRCFLSWPHAAITGRGWGCVVRECNATHPLMSWSCAWRTTNTRA
jgi:hypothetical protein